MKGWTVHHFDRSKTGSYFHRLVECCCGIGSFVDKEFGRFECGMTCLAIGRLDVGTDDILNALVLDHVNHLARRFYFEYACQDIEDGLPDSTKGA